MAAVILASLITNVQAAFSNYIDFDSINCWGESNIVLAWLKNDQSYNQFVSNRTNEILKLTRPEDWRYCPTNDNPADIGSRGQTISEFQNNWLWFKGPGWLRKPQEFWPKQSDSIDELKKLEENEEYVKEIRGSVFTLFATANAGSECITLDNIIEVERFSSLDELLRVTCYVRRFLQILRSRIAKANDKGEFSKEISTEEMANAENLWLRTAQSKLKENKNIRNLQEQLGLFVDTDFVTQCKGRIKKAELNYEASFPLSYLEIVRSQT